MQGLYWGERYVLAHGSWVEAGGIMGINRDNRDGLGFLVDAHLASQSSKLCQAEG